MRGVGAAGVGVGDAGGEELIGGEQGVLPGAPQDGGSGVGAIEGLGGGQKGGLGRGLNHGDIGDDNIPLSCCNIIRNGVPSVYRVCVYG